MGKVLFLIPVFALASCGWSALVTIENGGPVKEMSKEKIYAWVGSAKKIVMTRCRALVKREIAYKRCVDKGVRDAGQRVLAGLIGELILLSTRLVSV